MGRAPFLTGCSCVAASLLSFTELFDERTCCIRTISPDGTSGDRVKRSLFNCAHPFRQRWSIGCLAVALSCASLADEAPPAAAGAETQRLVDINEYVVRGNTVLDNRAIEAAVYPFLGPQRSLGDIGGARCAAGRLPGEGLPVGLRRAAGAAGERRGGLPAGHRDHCRSRPGGRRQALFAGGVARGKCRPWRRARCPTSPRSSASWRRSTAPPAARCCRWCARASGPAPWTSTCRWKTKSLARQHRPEQRLQRRHPSLALGGFAGLRQPLATRPRHLADLFHRAAGPGQRQGLVRLYTAPLSQRWSVQLSGYQSDSDVATVGSMNVVGQGHSYGVAAIYSLPVTGLWSHSFSFGVDFKDFEEQTRIGGNNDRVPIKVRPADSRLQRLPLHRTFPVGPWPEPGGRYRQSPRLRRRRRGIRTASVIAPSPASACSRAISTTP